MENKRVVSKEILFLRIELHKQIIKRMRQLGFCTSPNLIEIFKRWYLWDYHNVETSRTLSMNGLNSAITMLNRVDRQYAIKMLLTKYSKFNGERDLLKSTSGQEKKIQAIAFFSLKFTNKSLREYAKETLKRDVYLYDITMNEAHQLIVRLEKFEKKTV